MQDDDLLTADELQAILRVNRRTIYRMARAGTIPAARIGRQWRFPRRDIEAWLDAGGAGVPSREPAPARVAAPRE